MYKKIEIIEVCPRDGFQNIKTIIDKDVKIEIVKMLIDSGFKEIEIASFVNPNAVPQMAHVNEIIEEADRYRRINNIDVKFIALAPNFKGVENAINTNIDMINYPISVSEHHNKNNVNRTREQSFGELEDIFKMYGNIDISVGLSTSFGSPYQGDIIIIDDIIRMTERAFKIGAKKVILADTVGNGNPAFVDKVLTRLDKYVDLAKIGMHLHDTMGMALANTIVGLKHGVRTFESASGGLGGCPFAPGAAGNVATEDLLNMLNLMGFYTGINIDRVLDTVKVIDEKIDSSITSRMYNYHHKRMKLD